MVSKEHCDIAMVLEIYCHFLVLSNWTINILGEVHMKMSRKCSKWANMATHKSFPF